jgi:hypothetical protein
MKESGRGADDCLTTEALIATEYAQWNAEQLATMQEADCGGAEVSYGLARYREERARAWRAFRSDAFDALLMAAAIAGLIYFSDPAGFIAWICEISY